MSTRTQQLCLWCGPAMIALFMVGFWFVAGLVPPPSPNDSAEEILNLYRDDTDAIRVGLVLCIIAAALIGPFVVVISEQMKRVEGDSHPLADLQRGMGMIGIWVILLPVMLMQAAAFRPDRNPEITLALNDAAWLPFVGIATLFMVECAAIAICVFKDTEERVFPRWLAYFNVWAALLLVPAFLIYFFKTGPFAWSGIFTFWVGLAVLGLWFIVMFIAVRSAIQQQEREGAGLAGVQVAPQPADQMG
jgi:drug/metabolite transporter (DMT)-like permease